MVQVQHSDSAGRLKVKHVIGGVAKFGIDFFAFFRRIAEAAYAQLGPGNDQVGPQAPDFLTNPLKRGWDPRVAAAVPAIRPFLDQIGHAEDNAEATPNPIREVYLFVDIRVKPGRRAAFLEKLRAHGRNVRAEAGCLRLDILTGSAQGHSDRVFVQEIWASRALWDAHMENASSKAWGEVASEYVHGEEITVMDLRASL